MVMTPNRSLTELCEKPIPGSGLRELKVELHLAKELA